MLTIARRVAVDHYRRREAAPIVASRSTDSRPAYAELGQLADGLPRKERAAVVLRYGYDLSYAEIGAALGSSEDAARQAASSGVRRLQKEDAMTVSPTLDARFREAAAAAGLLDVAYDLADTPIGTLLVATTDRGLCRISYDPQPEREAESLARDVRRARAARGEADRPGAPPARRVLRGQADRVRPADRPPPPGAVQPRSPEPSSHACPTGSLTTYGALAAEAHRPKAARAVGTVMNRNPMPIVLPCHRVVGANGTLAGYGGGLERKELLLKLEGAIQLELGESVASDKRAARDS